MRSRGIPKSGRKRVAMRFPEWLIELVDRYRIAAEGRRTRATLIRTLVAEAVGPAVGRSHTSFSADAVGPTASAHSNLRPGDITSDRTRLVCVDFALITIASLDSIAQRRSHSTGLPVSRAAIIEYAVLLGLARRQALPSLDLGCVWARMEAVIVRAGMLAHVEWQRYACDDLTAFSPFPSSKADRDPVALRALGGLRFVRGKNGRWRCVTTDGHAIRHGSGVWLSFGAQVSTQQGRWLRLPTSMGRYPAVPSTFLWNGDLTVEPLYFIGAGVVKLMDEVEVHHLRKPVAVTLHAYAEGIRQHVQLRKSVPIEPSVAALVQDIQDAYAVDATHAAGFFSVVPGQLLDWKEAFVEADRIRARVEALRRARSDYVRVGCDTALGIALE